MDMCLLETQKNFQSKVEKKYVFSQKDGKEGTMESNILSMGQLLDKGYSVFMKIEFCT